MPPSTVRRLTSGIRGVVSCFFPVNMGTVSFQNDRRRASVLLVSQQTRPIPKRSSDRSSNYEQTGDRESVALIICPRTPQRYGRMSLVWRGELPRLGGDAELSSFLGGFVSGVDLELGQDGGDVVAHGAG